MTHIGIDPAFRSGGFAVAIIKDKLMTYHTMKSGFLDFITFMQVRFPAPEYFDKLSIIIENSNLQNVSFNMKGSAGMVARIARNVGANQAISQCTVDYCQSNYKFVREVSPKEKGQKLNQEAFNKLLDAAGISSAKKRINQDQRDAGYLAILSHQNDL